MDMRVNPRLLGLTLVAFAALAVPAFAASRIAGLSVMDGAGFASDESEVEFSGAVASIAAEMWVVGDQAFAVTPDTEIQDGIVVGDVVKVHALPNPDGSLTAREIEIDEDGAVEDIDDGDVDDGEHEDIDGDVNDGEHEDIDDGDVDDGEHEDIDDGDVDDGEQEDVDDDDVDGGEHEDGDDGERELGS
jgi:hypothetical protein